MNKGIIDPASRNYCGTVAEVCSLREILEADSIQVASILGSDVVVSKDVQVGDTLLFFPLECQLSREFLSANSLYRKAEYGNSDPMKTGFFDQSGRIRAVKLRGQKSMGFACPVSLLAFTGVDLSELVVGVDFDELNGIPICCKYRKSVNPSRLPKNQKAKKRAEDSIVDGQWRFHQDTENLRRNSHRIKPDDIVDITWKLHGTSVCLGNLLVQRDLTWYERMLNWMGVRIQTEVYANIWSSRKVVKGVGGAAKADASHYYTEDVWGSIAKKVECLIPKGFTVYGEIVGYTADGGAIQKMSGSAFDYRCNPGECELYVYRVTQTNVDGKVIELTAPQVREWCSSTGLNTVPPIYYGRADGLVGYQVGDLRDWQQALVDYLESYWVRDQDSVLCVNKVPEEGIVVRIDGLSSCEAFKLKSWRFLKCETDNLDQDVVDIEESQSVEEDV